jgi:sarcosine oxidase delta subunit
VIDPKINIRSKPTPSAQSEFLINGNAAIARADTEVQTRAYELYELRGRSDGHAEQDWYQAETDLRARSKKV